VRENSEKKTGELSRGLSDCGGRLRRGLGGGGMQGGKLGGGGVSGGSVECGGRVWSEGGGGEGGDGDVGVIEYSNRGTGTLTQAGVWGWTAVKRWGAEVRGN